MNSLSEISRSPAGGKERCGDEHRGETTTEFVIQQLTILAFGSAKNGAAVKNSEYKAPRLPSVVHSRLRRER